MTTYSWMSHSTCELLLWDIHSSPTIHKGTQNEESDRINSKHLSGPLRPTHWWYCCRNAQEPHLLSMNEQHKDEEKTIQEKPEKMTKITLWFNDGAVKQFEMKQSTFNLISHTLLFVGGLAIGCYLGSKKWGRKIHGFPSWEIHVSFTIFKIFSYSE